jgi:hypothetical protein
MAGALIVLAALNDHSCAWAFVLIAKSSPAPGEVVVT